MRRRVLLILVIVAALAALAGTISYAVARATNGGGHYASMMSGSAYTMMGSGGHPIAWYLKGSGPVRSIPVAQEQAQRFAGRLGLKTAEVIQFSGNYYIRLDDGHGKPATEVLVDPQTGAVTLEYGPAMMWNSRYGMMRATGATSSGGMMGGGMMGGGMMGSSAGSGMMTDMMGRYGSTPSWTPSAVSGPVGPTQAQQLANQWLARQGAAQTAREPDAFPGYYTMETHKNGKIAGMISVNKTTGAVWHHWWHGRFVAISE